MYYVRASLSMGFPRQEYCSGEPFPSPPLLNLSQHQDLFHESALLIRSPKYWSFNICPSSEYSRLISFRIDRLDLLAVQGLLKHLVQYYSSKASILQCSAFCIGNFIQPSHPLSSTSPSALNLSQHQDLFK